MLSDSPHRIRKDALHKLHAEGGYGTYKDSAFLGPSNFSTTPMRPKYNEVKSEVKLVVKVFPKTGRKRAVGKIKSHQVVDDNEKIYTVFFAEIEIPLVCRFAAIAQDLDYIAPIWANLIALTMVALSYIYKD